MKTRRVAIWKVEQLPHNDGSAVEAHLVSWMRIAISLDFTQMNHVKSFDTFDLVIQHNKGRRDCRWREPSDVRVQHNAMVGNLIKRSAIVNLLQFDTLAGIRTVDGQRRNKGLRRADWAGRTVVEDYFVCAARECFVVLRLQCGKKNSRTNTCLSAIESCNS